MAISGPFGMARARFKGWEPRLHLQDEDDEDDEPMRMEDHMKKMWAVGSVDSKWVYFNPVITAVCTFLLWGFVIWAMVRQEDAMEDVQVAQKWITDVWNWFYMISQNIWIVALLYVLFKYYDLKLGKDEDEPEFSDPVWFAMIFSCGVATGLWYYTAEAMWHYEGYDTPRWMDNEMFNDNTRAEHALMVTFFHWGLHGWIPYCVVGALLALLCYRRGLPMSMRFTLYPLVGEMCYGLLGDAVEVLSILCTVFGVTTSLGLGAMQINKGLVRLDRGTYRGEDTWVDGRVGFEMNTDTQIVVIVVITCLATMSILAGLKRGIAGLSVFAFALSIFAVLTVMFLDDTWYILNAISSAFGYYLWYLPKIAFHTDAWEQLGAASLGHGGAPDGRGGAAGWMNGWTIFYWGWWISWAPFVGTFLARISKGRRLGQFIITTLILPSAWSFMFLGTFGSAQIRISNQAKAAGLVGGSPSLTYGNLADKALIGYNATTWTPVDNGTTRLYNLATEDVLFEHLCAYGSFEFSMFLSIVTLAAIVIYFVTSSDSASYVVDIMAANGRPEPPVMQKVFWAFTEGAVAIALLSSSEDSLQAVKALPIILGLPFTFLLFWMCQGLVIVCREEAGELEVGRKHFNTFLLNVEPHSLIAVVAPFVPLGSISARVFEGRRAVYTAGFAILWVSFIALFALTAVDVAFASMAAAMWFLHGLSAAFVRVMLRRRSGISGDLVSDVCACIFALPFAVGQMMAEEIGPRHRHTIPTAVANAWAEKKHQDPAEDAPGNDHPVPVRLGSPQI